MQESRAITKKSASNLALAFVLLPKDKQDAMSALYAFCREVDDIADGESVPVEERRGQLNSWRADVQRACLHQNPQMPVNRELEPVIARYRLPFEHFDELIRGVEMDLDIKCYGNYEQLEHYCYRVASVVGLLSIEIFGYRNPASRDYAISLGKALQLTNILRDVRTDAARGRIYIPQSELARFKVTAEEIFQGKYTERFHLLARSVAERATHFYNEAARQLPQEDRRSMMAAELMGAVYWKLLRKLELEKFNVFRAESIGLSTAQKIFLIVREWLRLTLAAKGSSYGLR